VNDWRITKHATLLTRTAQQLINWTRAIPARSSWTTLIGGCALTGNGDGKEGEKRHKIPASRHRRHCGEISLATARRSGVVRGEKANVSVGNVGRQGARRELYIYIDDARTPN
jgi:hypothetical protein